MNKKSEEEETNVESLVTNFEFTDQTCVLVWIFPLKVLEKFAAFTTMVINPRRE